MKNLFAKVMAHYLADEDGLVTIEWVGIAAVVVVAGILITTAIMGSADDLGGQVNGALSGASIDSANVGISTDYGNYTTGTAG